jgi:hypothetical protein
LKSSVGNAFRRITRILAPPIAEPQAAKPKSEKELPLQSL